ncbi:hypothetical protein LUA82_03390 [Neoehrlichia mikurensis]|uniref:Uncharacterized protein n=1 Tax=Neoehrlichia mikurensis TaxID=89586 RepID=A0A9Q9BRN8_9RICK|nr:hypothetical protein [Neoehrlichia mikurensis]UTO55212.1 hypothetical protein LUA82_03390 [Neoehrlichia mikurensis]UTO56132.1 hypothetical protein LUA81_03355 [Neoehrlichia mikurensis]
MDKKSKYWMLMTSGCLLFATANICALVIYLRSPGNKMGMSIAVSIMTIVNILIMCNSLHNLLVYCLGAVGEKSNKLDGKRGYGLANMQKDFTENQQLAEVDMQESYTETKLLEDDALRLCNGLISKYNVDEIFKRLSDKKEGSNELDNVQEDYKESQQSEEVNMQKSSDEIKLLEENTLRSYDRLLIAQYCVSHDKELDINSVQNGRTR